MQRKIAVIGGNGQLGTEIVNVFGEAGWDAVAVNHDRLDIVDGEACRRVLASVRPQIVVNTAAAHDVEKCEADPTGSYLINAIGPRNLALAGNELDYTLVHISTDYIFDGSKRKPYVEADCPSPINVYANTKLAGEYFVRSSARRHFVVRASGLFGRAPCRAKGGRNFVTTMLRLGRERPEVRVVDDEILSPTHTQDVARQLVALVDTDAYGLYHAASHGQCSWYEAAAVIFARAKLPARLEVARPGEFPAKVARPAYSALDNAALRQHALDRMPDWQSGLHRYLDYILEAD